MLEEEDGQMTGVEDNFTLQEHRIAFLLVQHKSDEEICLKLCISINTARTWLKSIYRKYEIEGEGKGKRLIAAESYGKYIMRTFVEA